MNHLTPESEQREYIERCKKATDELKNDNPHTPAAPAERLCDECNIIELEEKVMHLEQQVKDEREKVIEILSDLNKYSCEEYEEASLSDNGREMRIHLEYGNRTWGIIRSLRGGAP